MLLFLLLHVIPYGSLWGTTALSILFPRKLYEVAVGQTVEFILSPPFNDQGTILF